MKRARSSIPRLGLPERETRPKVVPPLFEGPALPLRDLEAPLVPLEARSLGAPLQVPLEERAPRRDLEAPLVPLEARSLGTPLRVPLEERAGNRRKDAPLVLPYS